jgi:hypothetical protein
MLTIEEVHEILETLSSELPPTFFAQLNGGVNLIPKAVLSPYAQDNDLYVMGTYYNDRSMGRYINIYYGSFAAIYGDAPKYRWVSALRKTLRHEFTHHLESLAGVRDLEDKDARKLRGYTERRVRKTD